MYGAWIDPTTALQTVAPGQWSSSDDFEDVEGLIERQGTKERAWSCSLEPFVSSKIGNEKTYSILCYLGSGPGRQKWLYDHSMIEVLHVHRCMLFGLTFDSTVTRFSLGHTQDCSYLVWFGNVGWNKVMSSPIQVSYPCIER